MKPDNDLSRGLRKLRSLRPSQDFPDRLERSLLAVDRAERSAPPKPKRLRDALHGNLLLTLPAFASVAVAAHLLIAEPSFDVSRIAEHTVEIPEGGHAALDLGLWLDHHEADFASVRVHVPHGLTLTDSAEKDRDPDCHDTACIYEFMHPTDELAPPMRVEVRTPGRYRMKVEHASEGRRVHEVFVVHAR